MRYTDMKQEDLKVGMKFKHKRYSAKEYTLYVLDISKTHVIGEWRGTCASTPPKEDDIYISTVIGAIKDKEWILLSDEIGLNYEIY